MRTNIWQRSVGLEKVVLSPERSVANKEQACVTALEKCVTFELAMSWLYIARARWFIRLCLCIQTVGDCIYLGVSCVGTSCKDSWIDLLCKGLTKVRTWNDCWEHICNSLSHLLETPLSHWSPQSGESPLVSPSWSLHLSPQSLESPLVSPVSGVSTCLLILESPLVSPVPGVSMDLPSLWSLYYTPYFLESLVISPVSGVSTVSLSLHSHPWSP